MPRTEFHRLTVARVDPLTDDSAAVTFDVPPGLAERFAFTPGQSLTVRRGDERRSYSICAARGGEPQEVELFNARLDAAKLRALLPVTVDVAAVDHWWLCGPFGLVEDAIGLLAELGVPRRRIHRELFYVEDAPPAPATHAEAAAGPG